MIEDYIHGLATGGGGDGPIGFVDLGCLDGDGAGGGGDSGAFALPPWPLIWIGDPAHAAASLLDGVVEPPVSARALLAGATAQPHAAAVAITVLRATERMAAAPALAVESLAYGLLQGSDGFAAWLAARPSRAPAPAGRVRLARRDDVLRVVLDRPAARNAIDRPMRDALIDAFAVAADADIARVELRATGAAFSVGGDLAEFGTTRDPAVAHGIRLRALPARALLPVRRKVHVHVQGACVGAGLEIAALAGRVTAEPNAWFQLPELAIGLIPGAGGCVSVPRRIGRRRAALMILSGRRIGAATALDWGLVDAIEQRPPVDPDAADLDRA